MTPVPVALPDVQLLALLQLGLPAAEGPAEKPVRGNDREEHSFFSVYLEEEGQILISGRKGQDIGPKEISNLTAEQKSSLSA